MIKQNIFKNYKVLLVTFFAVMISSCNYSGYFRKTTKDFVKLDAPLENVLPKITVIVPEHQGKDGKALEVIVGETFKGKAEYKSNGETHELEYAMLNQHAVEGNKYIITVLSYNFGGTGRFYYLTGIDKTTLKSVYEVFLGDRVRIMSLKLRGTKKDTVDINYMDRKQRRAFSENPNQIKRINLSWLVGPPAAPQKFMDD